MSISGLSMDQLFSIRSTGGSEAPSWTPDGKAITFVSGLGGTTEFWAVYLTDGTLQRLSGSLGGVGHLASFLPRWSPNGDYISYVSATTGSDEVWLWPTDGSPSFQLTGVGARVEAIDWAPDGRSLVLASNRYGVFNIFRVEVPSGQTTRLTRDPRRYEVYPSFLPDGRILYVRLNEMWTDHDVILMNGDGSDPRVVLEDRDFFDYHYGRSFGAPNVSPDGTVFLFNSERSGWTNVWLASVEGNGNPRQIAPAAADQASAVWSPDGRWIAYTENHNGTVEIRIVSAAGGEPRRLVTPEMGVCSGLAWSPDGSKISYLHGNPLSPNDVWVVDVQSGTTRQLTFSMMGERISERLVQPEKVTYASFDGLEIPAYLYRPQQAPPAGKKYPGILWIHGGPTAQFMDTWQPQVQWFIQQGYVVLLPNIRGSSGYGKQFEALNDKDWGHGDLRDCIAGRDYLRTLPEVDGANIGITGVSYGGRMSMYAVAFAPGAFQAAIAGSGYSDFTHEFEQELRHRKMHEYELGPISPESVPTWLRSSSTYHIPQASTPCFIIHGEGRYPGSSASKEFALTLEANYKPVWYKAYQGETYYVSGGGNVRRMLQDMKAFFDLHLKRIPHTLADDAQRPLMHLSGVVTYPSERFMHHADGMRSFVGSPPQSVEDEPVEPRRD